MYAKRRLEGEMDQYNALKPRKDTSLKQVVILMKKFRTIPGRIWYQRCMAAQDRQHTVV